MPRLVSVWFAAIALVLAGGLLGAQERTGRLLQVDFLAFDAEGRHVPDLTAGDVELRLDGRRREVLSLRRIAAAPIAASSTTLAAPYGTSADAASGRLFVFVIDEDSFSAGREQPLRNAIAGLLNRMGPTDFVTVIGMPYGGVKVPVTNDHTRVRHAIDSASGQRTTGETGSQMACRTRLVLESLETVLRGMGARSAPSTVVLLTAGLAAPRRDAPMAMAPGMCELQSDLFKRVGAAAGMARANFYIAQPDDLAGSASRGSESISGAGFLGSDNPLGGIEDLAGSTRAVRLPLAALGTSAFDRIDRETASYYVAEVEPQLRDFDPRSQRLDVRVTRPGTTVRTRSEITFARSSAGSSGTRVTVSDMLTSAATFADLPLKAAAYTMGGAVGGTGDLQVVALGEPSDRATVLASAGAVLVDSQGAIVGRWSAVDAGESPLLGAFRVKPGRYRLRVAAVDAAGRGGAADYRFEAALTPVGTLALGDLILGLSRDGQLTPRLQFRDEPSALASFEIYGGTAGMAVTASLEVASTADGPALVTVPLTIAAQAVAGRYVAMGTVPLGALAPGDYAVRGVVRLDTGVSGRSVRTLRKVR